MGFFESFFVALSTYSAIPVPQFPWKDETMKYAICFFPAVGIFCGGAFFLWVILGEALQIGSFFFAAVGACIPVFVTGGIHMDGFMDTVDALASRQPRERKLEILKDSACGAFAVMGCAAYFLLFSGLLSELSGTRQILAVCPAFVTSRALSGILAVSLPNARKAGMLSAYTKNTGKRTAVLSLGAFFLLAAAAMIALSPVSGILALLWAFLSVFSYCRLVRKEFGGVTGDTSGFFLQVCELAMVFGVWLGGFFS